MNANENPPAPDSAPATYRHILTVQALIGMVLNDLIGRSLTHDRSKLEPPEKPAWDVATPNLHGLTYGSEEYEKQRRADALAEALEHHYAHNRHHPEFHGHLVCNGCFKKFPKDYDRRCDVCGYGQFQAEADIHGMNLIDLVEMLCDWKAATLRHHDGDIRKSIEVNQPRFKYSDDFKRILLNTVEYMGW